MVLSRRVILALLAICDIALYARAGRVSAREMSARHNLPPRHFESILQDLTHAGLIRGQRGPKGGYELALERRKIPISAIVDAVRSNAETDILPPDGLAIQLVTPVTQAVDRHLAGFLSEMTIDDVLTQASVTMAQENYDFTI